MVTAANKATLEYEVLPVIQSFLEERGLEFSNEKTNITHVEEGFDFLGQTMRKFNGKLIIQPAKKNTLTFLSNVRQINQANKQATAGTLILQLNPCTGYLLICQLSEKSKREFRRPIKHFCSHLYIQHLSRF